MVPVGAATTTELAETEKLAASIPLSCVSSPTVKQLLSLLSVEAKFDNLNFVELVLKNFEEIISLSRSNFNSVSPEYCLSLLVLCCCCCFI